MQSNPDSPPTPFPRHRLWEWLLFKKLHADFRWHRILLQDQNCNNLLVIVSIFSPLEGKNTTKGITFLIVYIILVFSVQKSPHNHILFYYKN